VICLQQTLRVFLSAPVFGRRPTRDWSHDENYRVRITKQEAGIPRPWITRRRNAKLDCLASMGPSTYTKVESPVPPAHQTTQQTQEIGKADPLGTRRSGIFPSGIPSIPR